MRRLIPLAVALALGVQPALADEFEEVVEGALEAYRAGDIGEARQELEYALTLLAEARAEGLMAFLPEPLPGWRREIADAASTGGGAFAMFGGGTGAAADYVRNGESFTITILTDAPMISGMAAMFSGMAAMGGGSTVRIQRQQFTVAEDEIQGIVDGRILVQASGEAPVEEMRAHIEAMDLRALAAY